MKKVSYTYTAEGSVAEHEGIVFVNDDVADETIADIIYNSLGFKLKIKTDPGYVHNGNGVYEKLKLLEASK